MSDQLRMTATQRTAIAPPGSRIAGLVRPRVAVACVMLLAAGLRLWDLGDAGFGTEYYAAAVRGMMLDGHNLLYNAFDPAGVLAVDKPPLAFWVQALSADVLGYSAFALMLPQALEGGLAVLLLWHLVRRDFGEIAGILAALLLAVTPVSVAVDRSNNTDSLLVLVLLLAAWALPRGEERAPWRLVAAMALVGVGFNVKMAAALGVLPGFVASYWLTTRATWPRRVAHLAAGGVALVAVSTVWIGFVALTPAEDRPYIDSSANNSIFDLAVNHNALQRFVPGARRRAAALASTGAASEPTAAPADATAPGTGRPARGAEAGPPPGVARLASPALASQCIWLFPLALAGAVVMIASRRREAACVWVFWALTYGVLFSWAGGLFSAYYLVMLAPPLAVLAAVGVTGLATACRAATPRRWWPPAVLVLGVAWQAHVLRPTAWGSTRCELLIAVLAGVLVGLGMLAAAIWRPGGATAVAGFATGVGALLIAPVVWSVTTIAHEGGRPLARLERAPDRFGRSVAAESNEIRALLPFLRAHRDDGRFLAATSNARMAAPLIIASGEPVVAFGGFMGTMPVLDGAALGRLADAGELRFVIVGNAQARRETAPQTDATRWVRAHGRRLDLAAIAPEIADARFDVYDLHDEPPLTAPPEH
jgi:4-amino-4-deoxy-L-arabinose transferase-like glycosyltransferase